MTQNEAMARTRVLQSMFGTGGNMDGLTWRPFRDGVEIAQIQGTMGAPGGSACLLRFSPGARVPLHYHDAMEVIVVLSGSQTDENGRHEAGTVLVSPPGTFHSIHSEDGCVVLAVYEEPVRFEA